MKKLMFVVFLFVSLVLIAEETNINESNWISYDGWVTGPGSVDNKYTYLLPFGYKKGRYNPEDATIYWQIYFDNYPLLYETDMGWPVPDANETELKYLFFGDTYFFMRDEHQCVMSKTTGPLGSVLLNFNINEDLDLCNSTDVAEIEKKYNFFPSSGTLLNAICYNHCPIVHPEYTEEQCAADCADISPSCADCINFCINPANSYVLPYLGSDANFLQCWNFCMFDTVNTYASAGYFLYDGSYFPEDQNEQIYNNGTSNIFLAADLHKNGSGNATKYNIKFHHPDREDSGSAQIYSTTDDTHRRSKSIWMNDYERDFISNPFVGIYPRGYFYACAGAPSDGCTSKKLFVPYSVTSWDFLTPATFCQNAFNRPHIVIPGSEVTELELSAGDELKNELERQKGSIGTGIYDFEDECRLRFSKDPLIPNLIFPYSFPSCETTDIDNECYQDPAYPNRNILWPNLSKMSNMTVIHDISKDILSIDDEEYPAGYIYFMGTGETEVHTGDFSLTCKTYDTPDIHYYNGANQNTVTKTTQKAYIARVPAYESEIKCAASYEYFSGMTNGIARWEKDMEKAVPLYGFYPLNVMEAESIVKHRDLYWMTARLNETAVTASHESKKGVVVLASPDAFHWQKVDTILFQNPDSIRANYAFFWLPPKMIKTGDNTMPFLYSIWKNHQDPVSGKYTLSGFLNPNLAPQFTRYNLKSGKYKFMEENMTRAFLADNAEYGYIFLNTIAGNTPEGTKDYPFFFSMPGRIPLPFKTFQNLKNLTYAGLTSNELTAKTEELKNRYAIIEYCYCDDQNEDLCKSSEGFCPPYNDFIETGEPGHDVGNWKIIDISDGSFFDEYVWPCKNGNENIPDYMCNIPFEHGENLPKGIRKTPVWNWWKQIAADHPSWNKDSAKVFLRFSHWRDLEFIPDNYPAINNQLMENNKLVPFDCSEVLAETDDNDEYPDEDELQDEDEMPDADADADVDEDLIAKTCKDPSSWRTSKQLTLTYKSFFDRVIDPNINFDLGLLSPIRLEYLYPYPVMINDFGKPGDPAPDIWDMLVADHFVREFFRVSSFAYGNSVTMNLMSGAAATAVIKNGTMTVYAWGGSEPPFIPGRNIYGLETLLYIGTYDPETEVVTFEQTTLSETEGSNSPEFTAGASMVYDDKNDKIYLIGALDKNGTTRIYSLEDDNMRSGLKTWRSVTTIDLGRYFRLVKKSEHEYFAFGGQTGTSTFSKKVYLLDLNNMASPQALQDIPTSGLANSFAAYSEMDQKLYVFGGLDENGASDRFLSYDIKTNTWNSINVSGGPGAGYGGVILVDYITETISLGGGVFVNNEDRNFKWIFDPKIMTWTKELKSGSYCLKEADSAIQGGIETSGTCVSFTHPFYNSFSAGTTVYSIAGKGNRLYAGTNDSIKIYDISDPNSPVLVSSFSTNNARVNDLEIEGDVLFAATSKGLYKLDASDPDELEQILFVSTGSTSQNEIELYDGKVYVGDNDGIKIRDKETLSVLLSANSGQVYDFAIENGEIAMFRSSFWNSGIQFRNAETLVETAYDYTSCNDVEVENFNGKLYLACDNYTYSFEANNGYIYFTQLSGDKRDLRENYTYNGHTYTPDGNYIRLSTNEEVSAICGNGIVEGDEVCDGTPIDCTELDVSGNVSTNSGFVSGIAACNQTCDGYVLDNCTAGNGGDGW